MDGPAVLGLPEVQQFVRGDENSGLLKRPQLNA
jgi:hypothetical protein